MSKKNKDKAALREKFAMAAMMPLAHAGRLVGIAGMDTNASVELYRPFARAAWRLADAMLLERDTAIEPPATSSDSAITV